ncbi:MAG: toxin-antitoxin system YwqK family antitoxin [Saprospiraceae bacterium]
MELKICLLIILNIWFLNPMKSQIIDYDWNINELIENQIQKFSDGNVRIKNLQPNDTIWRYEFTTCGELKIEAQISQLVFGDSTIKFNEDTYEELLYITYFKKDIPNGKFIKYFDNGKIEEKGNYLNGNKFGNWKEYFTSGKVKRITIYNKKGKREGNYVEYYSNGKVKGRYAIKKIVQKKTWFDGETYEEFEGESVFEYEIKKGKWQYFSKYGKLQSEVEYQ